eukprot:410273-Pleurochrysis_carterae.AAC.1
MPTRNEVSVHEARSASPQDTERRGSDRNRERAEQIVRVVSRGVRERQRSQGRRIVARALVGERSAKSGETGEGWHRSEQRDAQGERTRATARGAQG